MKQVNNSRLQKIGLKTIPKTWDEINLKRILETSYLGGNYPNSEINNGLPLIKMGNIGRGAIVLVRVEYLPNDLEVDEEHFLKEGDLLFNTRNTLDLVGKVSVWKNELPKAVCNSNLLKMFFKGDKVYSNYFMNYVFNSYYVLKQLRAIATGTTSVAAIYDRDLKNITVLLPSLDEQKIIESILFTWDNAIEKTKNSLKQKRRLKKGLMQRLLTGKMRFKGFENERWRSIRISDWGEIIRGVTYKPQIDLRQADDQNTIRLLRANNILNGRLNDDEVQFVVNKRVSDKQTLVPKDIVLCMANGSKALVGKSALYKGNAKHSYTIGAFCAIYRSKETQNSDYVFQLFQSAKYRAGIKVLLAGSSINNLRGADVGGLKFTVPTNLSERQKIISILSVLDSETELLTKKFEILKAQKKSLMQKLLTGKIRVKV